jgi:hypothetical protein
MMPVKGQFATRVMTYSILALLFLTLGSGCATRRSVRFPSGDALLEAASHIKIGDSRNEVVYYLGWRREEGQVEAAYFSPDDGGGLIHPWIAFWNWRVYPVSLEVDFTYDARVYQIKYYDDRKEPDGPYMLIGPKMACPPTRNP